MATNSRNCPEDALQPLHWDQSYSVNALVLDEQHKILFNIINELRAACIAGIEKAGLLAIIKTLYEYSATHFRDEEALLCKKQSPLLEDQQAQHAIFLDYIIDLEARVKSDTASVNEDILTFVMVWWEEHILKLDTQYRPLF